VGDKVALVERLLERGVLADNTADAHGDGSRAITRNRQPGKCCDSGCSVPGQAIMVDLPKSTRQA
jgi:4-hydroxybutyryl-CoA dehydratase/vinylacetyl-CoA-Delta-isomerase